LSVQIKNIVLFVAIIFLCQCNKESEAPYANEDIVRDNAQAALYFHAIFCEAENVWAFIDSMDYAEGVYQDPANTQTAYKELTCTEVESASSVNNTVIVEYKNWKTSHLSLAGRMRVVFSNDSSYRKNGKVANVYLDDFSINGQDVAGESTIKFTGTSEKDLYTFTLLNGSAIYRLGRSNTALISCAITNGLQYERVEGRETFSPEDDLWAYHGAMTGQLRNDPALKYTNTVSATYTENGASKDGRVRFDMNCTTAQSGRALIKIQGRSDILFAYDCSQCIFLTVTQVF